MLARSYKCGGYASYNGPCGGDDCTSCHPGYSQESEASYIEDREEIAIAMIGHALELHDDGKKEEALNVLRSVAKSLRAAQ